MALNKGIALNWREERDDAGMFDSFMFILNMYERKFGPCTFFLNGRIVAYVVVFYFMPGCGNCKEWGLYLC